MVSKYVTVPQSASTTISSIVVSSRNDAKLNNMQTEENV